MLYSLEEYESDKDYSFVCQRELIEFWNEWIIDIVQLDSYLSCSGLEEVDGDSLRIVGLYRCLVNFVLEYGKTRRDTSSLNFGISCFDKNNCIEGS